MSPTSKVWLVAVSFVIIVALVVGWIIWPNYQRANAVNRQIDTLAAKVAGFGEQTQRIKALEAELVTARDRITNGFKLIPPTHDLAGLIRKLSQDVDRVRVTDQTFTAGSVCNAIAGGTGAPGSGASAAAAAATAVPLAMPLTVDMEATFESVFALIRNAESMQRLVRVASVKVLCKRNSDRGTGNSYFRPLVQASIGLEAIFDPDTGEGKGATSWEARSSATQGEKNEGTVGALGQNTEVGVPEGDGVPDIEAFMPQADPPRRIVDGERTSGGGGR